MNLMTMCRSSSVPIQSKGVGEELFRPAITPLGLWHTLGDARLRSMEALSSRPVWTCHLHTGHAGLYSRASRKVMACLREPAVLFEKASIDEAYLDVTETVGGDWDAALALANQLQQAIKERVNLTASFGIGPTRIVAKMSSEVNKPNGIHRVMPDEVVSFFQGRSLRDIPGIGPKRATQLAEWGYTTADELHELGELSLARLAGDRFAHWFMRVVEGESSAGSARFAAGNPLARSTRSNGTLTTMKTSFQGWRRSWTSSWSVLAVLGYPADWVR